MRDPIDPRSIVVADELPERDLVEGRPWNTRRTWILRWPGGDSRAMTEDEADQLAAGLRALAKHDAGIR